MNHLKYFEKYSDQTYDLIYSNFLEIADDYNFTKVDDVFKSDIQDTVYEINYSNVHECYLIKIFFEDNLSGVSDDNKNLSYKFISNLDNFSHSLMREDLEVKIDYFKGNLIMDIYIRDFLKKQNESKSVDDDFDQLKDVFLDLYDEGYDVSFYKGKDDNQIQDYRVVIKKEKTFNFDNILCETLRRSVLVMTDLGYRYQATYKVWHSLPQKFYIYLDERGLRSSGVKLNETWPDVHSIVVDFYI